MEAVTIEDQIAEVKRELAMRERVYPRWINAPKPKLTPATGERQMSRLRAVLATLEQQAELLAAFNALVDWGEDEVAYGVPKDLLERACGALRRAGWYEAQAKKTAAAVSRGEL